MTRTNALRKIFKKFFGIDAKGNSVSAVLNDVINNNETLPGSGGGGGVVHLRFDFDEVSGETSWVGQSYTSLEIKEMIENNILPVVHISNGIFEASSSQGHIYIDFMSPGVTFTMESLSVDEDGVATVYDGGNAS